MIGLWVLIFIGVIIESTVVSFPLPLIIVFLGSTVFDEKAEMIAFVGGILLDIFTLRYLGTDGLIFLALVVLWKTYGRKIYPNRVVFRLIFLFFAVLFYDYLFYKSLNLISLILTEFAGFVFLLSLSRISPKSWEKEKLSF